jgi:DNA-binding CsgD family transcriptional regulator
MGQHREGLTVAARCYRRGSMKTTGAGVFGREREFVAVTSLAGKHDEPWALILEGEPGMGKTTLWRLGVGQAERSGQRVLTSSPASGETQLSFAVLSDLLAEALAQVSGEMPVPQRRALEVALLLDDVSDEAAEPRTVFAATHTCLRALAEREPVVIAIDDVQWIDPPSAAALSYAIRRLGDTRVSILAARRVEQATTDRSDFENALAHRHGQGLQRVEVGPVSADVLHAAILDQLGLAYPHSVVERIHHASGGNPFYALEIARALERHPEAHEPGSALPVPDTLQQLVRSRLDELSPPTRNLLDVVALLSDPALARLDAAGVRGSVEDAVSAGVIEITDDERARFSHPLLASAAAARLAPDSRRALHMRLADLVEGEERARHLALGAEGPSAEAALALEQAAREAAGRGAIGAAAELAEQALRLTPPAMRDELRERQLEAAAYEVRHGDITHARRHLEPLLAELPPGPTRAGVLLQLARTGEQAAARALELCQQAIAEAGPDDARAAEAHQLAAEMSMLSGDIPSALEHARLACQLADAAGDRAKLIESLGTLCHYQTYTGTIEPGLLEGAVELEREQARPSNNYSPREIFGLRLMYADRLDEARELLQASFATATELGDELDRGALLIHMTQLECRAGRLADAGQHARACLVTHEQSSYGLAGARFVVALADAHLGRVSEARASAEDGAELARKGGNQVFRVLNEWALGFLELSLGNHDAADVRLRDLPSVVDAMGYRNPGVRPVHADAIEARIGVGAADPGVEQMIDDLAERGRAFANPSIIGAAERCRGLLTAQRGDLEDGVAYLEGSLSELGSSPQPLQRGRTLLALGATLRRAKRRREAREALGQALEIFDLLGAPLWAERAASELARIPGRVASTGELSETERRVAELVAEGLSNKEVAARLFVSVRTVEANLSSVYTKMGLRSRSELAGRMSQR